MSHLRADFVADLNAIAEQELLRRGIGRPTHKKLKGVHRPDALTRLLTVEHRLVPRRRRQTRWSDALERRARDDLLRAAERLALESETGQDLSHYLGRGLSRAEPDGQLNDWGITHLHLGERRPGQAFSEGTKDLLFVIPTFECMYFIDIGDHDSFEDIELFEIVHRTWPELLADCRPQNVVPGSSNLTAEQSGRLRRAGFVTLTQVQDGAIYVPPGMGQFSNGISMRVGRAVDAMATRAHSFQVLCEHHVDQIVAGAASLGIVLSDAVIDVRMTGYGAMVVAQDLRGRFWLTSDGSVLQVWSHDPAAAAEL